MTNPTQEEAKIENPFKIIGHPRYDFRNWIRQEFPDLLLHSSGKEEYPELARRFPEVHRAAMDVLERVMRFSGESLQDYYRQDFIKLPEAFAARDVKAYAAQLDSFVGGIDWE
jgi:hypothetical protein